MVARTILTYDGMQTAPQDGLRRELLGGDLYVSPAPSPAHQVVVAGLVIALGAYAGQHGGQVLPAPVDVVFSQIDATQPDVIYLAPDRLSLIGEKNVQGAPSLVIEVLSPSTADVDRGSKLGTYARHGVPEYWIIDPATRRIVSHAEPDDARYLRTATSVDGTIVALTLPGLRFVLPP